MPVKQRERDIYIYRSADCSRASWRQVSHAVFGSLFKAQHKQDPHLTKSCST